MATLADGSADEKRWISSPVGRWGALERLIQLTQPSPTVVRRVELVVIGVVVAIAAALTSAILILNLGAGNILTMAQALLASAVFTLGGGALFIWTSSSWQWNRLAVRLIATYGVATILIVVNVLIAASALFTSERDLKILALLLFYATAITAIFSYLVSSSLDDSVRALSHAARRMTTGELDSRIPEPPERELAELGDALNSMASRLESATNRERELEESQRNLIAAISHELRTPISSLRVMVESINDDIAVDPATVRRCTKVMERETRSIGRLIDGILELARLDAGQTRLRLQPQAIETVVREAVESLAGQAVIQGISVETTFNPRVPTVLIDPEQMFRAIHILIENGIRWTPAHGTLTIRVIDRGADLQVDVHGSGTGGAASDWPGMFDRFRPRGDAGSDDSFSAEGFGLPIAKRIVEMHGGHLWSVNPPEGGSTSSFTVPKSKPGK